MGKAAPADFHAGETAGETPAAAPPQVFVRTFATPAGLPWDQVRAAHLEARHGAPLPIGDLVHRLRRLDRWAPGRAGRFAVFYVRRRDYLGPFETLVDVDGDPLRVSFGSTAGPSRQARAIGVAVAALAASGLFSAGAITVALSLRQEADEQLSMLERQAAAKLQMAQRRQTTRLQNEDLARLQQGAGLPADVLADLMWLAESKAVDARIVAVHWDRGLMAVEARGEMAPVVSAEREVVRASPSGRTGLSLWGIGRADGGRALQTATRQ